MKATAEMTDSYGGVANYGWVRRCEVEGKSELSVVRQVKERFGLTGLKCERTNFGDQIWLKPRGMNRLIFIYFGD